MQLRRRLARGLAVATLFLAALAAAALALREMRWRERYEAAALAAQAQAWARLQEDALADLRATLAALTAAPGWTEAWRAADSQAMLRMADAALRGRDGLQVDLYGAQGALLGSTSVELEVAALVEPHQALAVARGEQRFAAGLRALSADRFVWVLVQGPGGAAGSGALAAGLDLRVRFGALPGLLVPAASTAPQAFLLSLRGQEQLRSGLLSYASLGLAAPARDPEAALERGSDGRAWLRVSQLVPDLDDRPAGLLVTLVERSGAADAERVEDIALAVALTVLLMAGAALALLWVRLALDPVERGTATLEQLAAGNAGARMDDDDGLRGDEAGRMAKAIDRLRHELFSLQTLREERTRVARQQERIIRKQLRELAGSLDDSSRQEIISQIEGTEASPDEQEHQLARLAAILGRMSGLVTTQQSRLLDLLRELRASMETRALFASLQQELEIARQMQLAILPRAAPRTAAVEIGATMIPAREVGGDFYDFFLVDELHLAVVVADVSGKGVPAAFFMAIARTLLKNNALLLREPVPVMARLNDQLATDNDQAMFVTVFFGVLDLGSGELRYVNAGHNPPVHVGAAGLRLLPRGGNPAVGMMDGLAFREGRLSLARGDALVLYTDGVTEAQNAAGEFFGEPALLRVLAETADAPAADWPAALLTGLQRFEAGAAHADDITCVVVRYRGANPIQGV
jgi:sigma-B regulation protein RsbU (phosphoserine phosphatase)